MSDNTLEKDKSQALPIREGQPPSLSPVCISLGEKDTSCIPVSIDTLKIGFKREAIKGWDDSKFDKIVRSGINDNGKEYVRTHWELQRKYKPNGLAMLQIDEDGEGIIEGSAKLLGSDYLKGINKDTFSKWVDTLNNNYEAYGFDASELYEGSKVYRSDPCINIKPSEELNKYFLAVDYSPLRNYKTSLYEGTGRVISSTRRSVELKDRLTIYDKALEMEKPKNKWLEVEASGVLRIEANVRNFEQTRRLYGIESIYNEIKVGERTNLSENSNHPILLREIFKAKKHPIKEIFNNIFSEVKSDQYVFDFFDTYSHFKFYELEKILGRIAIARHFDFDMSRIIAFIKSRVRGKISKYVKGYQEAIQISKSQEDREGYIDKMEELKSLVNEACQ